MDLDNSSDDWKWKNSVGNKERWLAETINYVYRSNDDDSEGDDMLHSELNLENLPDYIDRELDNVVLKLPNFPDEEGRLGPSHVIFDGSSNVGSLVIDKDRLGLSSQSNFSSIHANCCVYKGKWQYELMLGSKGVMQVGWATIHCKFSQEKGVGDTSDSYAYDGNRIRKWNVSAQKYGEAWLTGDVIGCTIDLDNGSICFYRNGQSLGEAFDNIRIGPGIAYFPAVSLAYNENLVANFGAVPFRHPVPGFHPLESIPYHNIAKATKLFSWLRRLLTLYISTVQNRMEPILQDAKIVNNLIKECNKTHIFLLAVPLLNKLGPYLVSPYINESCFLSFLFQLCGDIPKDNSYNIKEVKSPILALLDMLWALLESHEIQQCLEHLIVALLTGYRFSPAMKDFYQQKCYLILMLNILRHRASRKFLLQNVLFDKIKFPVFLEVKPMDNIILAEMIPHVCIDGYEEELWKKAAFEESSKVLKKVVLELENIQLEILIQLFDGTDMKQGQSSRTIFLAKFREFLKENSGVARSQLINLCPLPVALAFFHRLVSLLRHCLTIYCLKNPQTGNVITTNDLTVSINVFYDNSINYFEIQRIGGLISHLQKIFKDNILEAVGPSHKTFPQLLEDKKNSKLPDKTIKFGEKDDYEACIELLDGIIRLYQISAHRQLEKMCSLRDSMQEYIMALKDIEKRHNPNDVEVEIALKHTKEVFICKLTEQARHQAWISVVVYASEKQLDVYWILQILLRTLELASNSDDFFGFVPDFYVEACIRCCNALRSFFPPTSPIENLTGYQEILVKYGTFLAHHFADRRVVNAELKDSLVQALAAYVCHPTTLKALEEMPQKSQTIMVKALLQPYENRAWAQSNWILVRLWKGCGFAFRYSLPPHMTRRFNLKSQQQAECATSSHHRPCPSVIFQQHIVQWLLEHPDHAAAFLSSVLTQLNWAFSEFIGMLQEIQNASNRPERVFIDSRQLKICATCFDLALALLRVLEMIVHLVPELFTDVSKPSSEIFLPRLFQLVCQVLNRVTSRSGCFYLVVSMEIPGLETIDHFPIIAAVTGILTSLILEGSPSSRECAIIALLAEPSFQPSCLDFLLGEVATASVGKRAKERPFNLRNFNEVSEEEIRKVEQLIHLLQSRHHAISLAQADKIINEEELCTICYANRKSALFEPCGHESCRACISLHLLSHRECFFCKAIVDTVTSSDGEVLLPTPNKTVSK
ncbi:E3 ubiquitin-protein ligase RNF123-like [Centruroides vittatus]|uniref:E3 ubiquitin-protein ligase RNF123-like n=1 Tax=Centruroides vittatus TaxID=120091 RepID=UPI00350EAC76